MIRIVFLLLLLMSVSWADTLSVSDPSAATRTDTAMSRSEASPSNPDILFPELQDKRLNGTEDAFQHSEFGDHAARLVKPSPEISTELQGVDSLDIAPEELVTTYEGGTRRVKIERTVFRRETPVVYDPAGRRDPFRALLVDEKKEGEIETELLRIENAVLTGVVWSNGQYLAMVKDKDGRNFFLREGDPIFQGQVVSVSQNQAVFEVSDFGDYQRYTLKVKG